jgi:hypothetical protein
MNSPIVSWLSPAAATVLFWVAVSVCAVAQLYILRAVFRTLPDAPTNSAVPAPRQWAEVVQALIPLVGLSALFYGAWRALGLGA